MHRRRSLDGWLAGWRMKDPLHGKGWLLPQFAAGGVAGK